MVHTFAIELIDLHEARDHEMQLCWIHCIVMRNERTMSFDDPKNGGEMHFYEEKKNGPHAAI